MSINYNEKRTSSLKKLKTEIKQNLSKPQTLEEYFLVIGVDPKICAKEYLYNTSIEELNDYYSKNDFKPKILSKFPPINKQYINVDSSLIELCFPEGYKLEQFYFQPNPVVEHFLLDNSFYSIDYPFKYVTCLKIYESLEKYFILNNELKNTLGEDYYNNTRKLNTGKKNKNEIIKAIGNIDSNFLKHSERFRSEIGFIINDKNNDDISDNYKRYYFPKILCLVSAQHYFREQYKILKQLYKYYMDNNPKKIPLEKKILTILFNIPLPPKGLLRLEYNLDERYDKIIIKGEQMNKIPIMYEELNLIFKKFSINKLLIIIRYIIFETKTVIFSTKKNHLANFIYGIISLLFPFHFSFQVSSSIPNGAYDILESISPYILGINTKYRKSFFPENKIELNDLNLFIIDLDENSIKITGKDIYNLPELPKTLYKTLHDGLEAEFGIKRRILNFKTEINFKSVRKLFYDFFVNILFDYELYLKKDYFKNKLSNTAIKHLFKIKEFIESHPNSDRAFYKRFTETQMFSDFISKKMIPKNLNEKLEVLFVDETLIKKNNKKLFSKKKSTVFLDSNDYEHSQIYEIPQSKILSKRERNFFVEEDDRNDLLLYGQKITESKNEKTNEKEYLFEYYLFPILNKSFFESPPPGEYFLAPDSILFSDVDRANTDILSKSFNNSSKNCEKKILEEEMQNYIYLTYIELWAYSYWYIDSSEKDSKFNQMLEILNKITNHEVELFDLLFEALNKFKEFDKILVLYDCLLKYKILPSSFIYSTVNMLLNNKDKLTKTKSFLNINLARLSSDISSKQKKHIKRTFHSIKEGNLIGDKVIFYSKQPCPECDKDIDMVEVSLNFKNMKKELFWTKCPSCGKNIIPKIGVILGSEMIKINENDNKEYNNNNDINTSKYSQFVLHSPYELKNNIKNIINKDGFKIFHLEHFKEKYPSLFWSCVWYFKINKIDLDIILPYEWNTLQDFNKNNQNSFQMNIISLTKTKTKDEKNSNIKQIYIKKYKKENNSKKIKIKKYSNDKILIHNAISLQINDTKYRRSYWNTSSISSLFDLYRKSTISSNSNTEVRKSAHFPIPNTIKKVEISKKRTVKVALPPNFRKISLKDSTNLSHKNLLSPCFTPRQLLIGSNDLLSIKENEDYYVSPFNKYSMKTMKEENDEDDDNNSLYLDGIGLSKKRSTKIFNFEDNEINIYEIKKTRSFSQKKQKTIDLKEGEYKRNNSMKLKDIDLNSLF